MTDIREIATLEEAMALIDEYIRAYNELRCEYVRLQHRHARLMHRLEHADAALDNFEFAWRIERWL